MRCCSGTEEDGVQVDIHHIQPRLVTHFFGRLVDTDTGVVEGYVETAQNRHHAVHHILYGQRLGHITAGSRRPDVPDP